MTNEPKGYPCMDDSPCNNGSGDWRDYEDIRYMIFREEEPDEDEEIEPHTEQGI